jgi:hypothetical protein
MNRTDHLVKLVTDSNNGNPDSLLNELEAIISFLRTWERDYGNEKQPRMAMITGIVADLATILATQALANQGESQ